MEKNTAELNKIYGKRLVMLAWGIEIIAAIIGLFIGISSALFSIEYYSELDESVIVGNTFSNVFVGAAPFIIIAIVELTKIPLALGFYKARKTIWKILFLGTLLMLVLITFQTMFNGLERNFSALESKIQKPRSEFQNKKKELVALEDTLKSIQTKSKQNIEEEFSNKNSQVESERQVQLNNLRLDRDKEIKAISIQIAELTENYALISDFNGLKSKAARLRNDLRSAQAKHTEDTKLENDVYENRLMQIELAIQTIDNNMVEEIKNKSFFRSATPIREYAYQIRRPLEIELQELSNEHKKNKSTIDANYKSIEKSLLNEIQVTESDLAKVQSVGSGSLEKNIQSLQERIDEISGKYNLSLEDLNNFFNKRIDLLKNEREESLRLRQIRIKEIPELESQEILIKKELLDLETVINQASRENNIYRITSRFYNKESAADIKVEELKVITSIWFGSIALIAALVGSIIALAGFVLQDTRAEEENKRTSLSKLLRNIFIQIRIYYKNRRMGVLRKSIRALIIDIRKWFRSPKIKFKEIKVLTEVIKEVPVPGPEKVIVKEVPVEIVKQELVYVPLTDHKEVKQPKAPIKTRTPAKKNG